ncbi:MAG: hypothetical protein ACOY0T_26455 [Myxococcota bacterium]
MKRAACERTWEAEAFENGRLGGAERGAFERHAVTCEACQSELAGLRAVHEAMQHLPDFAANTFELRHQRSRLLQRANQAAGAPASRRRVPVWLAAALILVLVGAASASMLLGHKPEASPANKPSIPVSAAMQKSPQAKVLPSPAAVPAAEAAVELPESPKAVAALAPSAAFNEQAAPGVALNVATTANSAARSANNVSSVTPRKRDSAGPVGPASGAPSATPPLRSSESAQLADSFALATSAFRGGAYARAERLFAEFAVRAPRDPRAEDAAFLRAVSRFRLGDAAGAAALARDYLRAFPRGLRRVEAERLANAR